jgi:hypothetical protein
VVLKKCNPCFELQRKFTEIRLSKMYKKAKFLFFCMIFVAGGAFCQNYTAKKISVADIYTVKWIYRANNNITYQNYFQLSKNNIKKKLVANAKPVVYVSPLSSSILPSDFYTCNFGFFCKTELKFEKITKIPLRFRLGSLQHNNYLEGKPNTGILPTY